MAQFFDSHELHPIIIIPMEDDLVHTAENGYCCGDPTCYCAGDTSNPTIVEGSLSYVVDDPGSLLN